MYGKNMLMLLFTLSTICSLIPHSQKNITYRQKQLAGHYESQQIPSESAALMNKWGLMEEDF